MKWAKSIGFCDFFAFLQVFSSKISRKSRKTDGKRKILSREGKRVAESEVLFSKINVSLPFVCL